MTKRARTAHDFCTGRAARGQKIDHTEPAAAASHELKDQEYDDGERKEKVDLYRSSSTTM